MSRIYKWVIRPPKSPRIQPPLPAAGRDEAQHLPELSPRLTNAGSRRYWKALYLDGFSDAAIATTVDWSNRRPAEDATAHRRSSRRAKRADLDLVEKIALRWVTAIAASKTMKGSIGAR